MSSFIIQHHDELSGELEKIEFSTNDSDNFCFLTANDVFEKLKDNKPENLCIVSPFLNTKALKTLQNNGITISGVYTSDMNITNENEDEYKNFKDILYINKGLKKSNNETNNDNECESVPLVHAKIYCWQKDNMTHWIIGSSNATENGWYQKNSDNKFVGNSELNVYFTTKTEDYVKFKNQLEDDLFDPFIFETLKSDKKTKNRNELSDIMVSILNNLSVVECKKDETQYICKLEINIEKINERIKNDSDVKWEISALNGNVKIENNCLKSKEPFFSIMICVSKTDK